MATKKRYIMRYMLIALVFCVVCVVYLGRLFYIQIAGRGQGGESANTVVTVKVQGVRGDIFDRNGNPLVTTDYTYDLSLSYASLALIGSSRANATYMRLLEALDACGEQDAHSELYFPFDGTYPDYAFRAQVSDPDSVISYRLRRTLKARGLKESATVEEILADYLDSYRLLETDGEGNRVYSDYQVDRLLRLLYDMDAQQFSAVNDYVFATEADLSLITYVQELGLTGVRVTENAKRVYHYPGYASHILGSVGPIYAEEWDYYNEQGYQMNAMVGKSGCEAAFEEYLRGTDGEWELTLDVNGNVIERRVITPPVSGKDVYLTLDIHLQIAAEDALAENVQYVRENDTGAIAGFESDAGAAVVMDPNTFEILALASYPTYDLNTYNATYAELVSDSARPLVNRALRETYAPGSTFKVGVALAGLDAGVITSDYKVFCDGAYELGTHSFGCSTYPHASSYVSMTQAIADSCNSFFYEVGVELGIGKLDAYMARFGFGKNTGVELGEAVGVLAGEAGSYVGDWMGGNTAQAAIGQSDTKATPLQICAYISTVANGGTRYSAHLLDRVCEFGSENPVYSDETLLISPLDQVSVTPQNHALILDAMKQMVNGSNTVKRFLNQSDVAPASVGGKTGTAQFERYVTNEATGETEKIVITNALFVGIYNTEAPELAVSVVIEKASSGTLASLTAARIFGAWEDAKAAS